MSPQGSALSNTLSVKSHRLFPTIGTKAVSRRVVTQSKTVERSSGSQSGIPSVVKRALENNDSERDPKAPSPHKKMKLAVNNEVSDEQAVHAKHYNDITLYPTFMQRFESASREAKRSWDRLDTAIFTQGKQFVELESKVNTMTDSVANDVGPIKSEIEDVKSALLTRDGSVSQLSTKLENITASVEQIKKGIKTARATENIQSQVHNLQRSIVTLQSEVNTLRNNTDSTREQLLSKCSDLTVQVQGLATKEVEGRNTLSDNDLKWQEQEKRDAEFYTEQKAIHQKFTECDTQAIALRAEVQRLLAAFDDLPNTCKPRCYQQAGNIQKPDTYNRHVSHNVAPQTPRRTETKWQEQHIGSTSRAYIGKSDDHNSTSSHVNRLEKRIEKLEEGLGTRLRGDELEKKVDTMQTTITTSVTAAHEQHIKATSTKLDNCMATWRVEQETARVQVEFNLRKYVEETLAENIRATVVGILEAQQKEFDAKFITGLANVDVDFQPPGALKNYMSKLLFDTESQSKTQDGISFKIQNICRSLETVKSGLKTVTNTIADDKSELTADITALKLGMSDKIASHQHRLISDEQLMINHGNKLCKCCENLNRVKQVLIPNQQASCIQPTPLERHPSINPQTQRKQPWPTTQGTISTDQQCQSFVPQQPQPQMLPPSPVSLLEPRS